MAAVAPLLLMARGAGAQRRPADLPFATRSEVLARGGMAATSQPLATQAALEIMRKGGNAVDAAIAANAVLGVVEPTGCGLGGDLFALVREAGKEAPLGLNASGRSPAGLTLARLKEIGLQAIPDHGPLPVTVPGCVDGWCELHARFGRLPLPALLAPAAAYAREGFPVSPIIARHWARNAALLERWSGFKQVFMPGGRAPAKGELFRNPGLAALLERIGREGRAAFYRGAAAQAMAAAVREAGGFLSEADLEAHRSEWVEPISVVYRGWRVWGLPPNCQGLTTLQMLALLSGHDLARLGFGSAAYAHLLIEAKKLAFEDRARWCADPAFAPAPLEALLSGKYASQRMKRIDPDRAADSFPAGDPIGSDTVYLATADREGNMVSLIQSNYRGMGSGITPAGLGFVLQDRGALFDLEPGRANTYAPAKRPFHTIIPGFASRGKEAFLAFGVMGGDMQPQGQVQVLVNYLDFGMNLQEAGDAPRLRHDGSSSPTGSRMADGGRVALEPGFPADLARGLAARGHRLLPEGSGDFGGYQAILREERSGVLVGASESRKDGQAAGF